MESSFVFMDEAPGLHAQCEQSRCSVEALRYSSRRYSISCNVVPNLHHLLFVAEEGGEQEEG